MNNTERPGWFRNALTSISIYFSIISCVFLVSITQAFAQDRYWVLGPGNWDAVTTTNWSTTSGGAGGASVPTATDNVIFDTLSSGVGYTVTVTATANCLSLTIGQPLTGTLIFAGSSALNITGNLSIASGVSMTYTGTMTFNATTTGKTITTNGVSLSNPVTFNGAGGSWLLQDDLTVTNTQTTTLTAGIFNANGKNFSTGLFSSSNSNTRTITQGAGSWTITGNAGTVWTTATDTNLTVNKSSALIFNYSGSTGTRTISMANTLAKVLDVSVTAGTDTFAITNGTAVGTLDFTGFAGTQTGNYFIYGNLVISTGMTPSTGAISFASTSGTKTITTNNKTMGDISFTGIGGTWQLLDNLTSSSASIMTLTAGTFNANGFNVTTGTFSSNNTNTRTLTMGSGQWTLSRNGNTVWGVADATNFTLNRSSNAIIVNYSGGTGTRIISHGGTSSSGTEANSPDFNITAGTDTLNVSTSTVRHLDFTGFAGTLSNGTRTLYGNLTVSTGMTLTAGTSVTSFASTLLTQSITSNGKTLDFPVTVSSSSSGSVSLADNLTIGSTRTFTLTSGTFTDNNKNFSTGLFSSSNSNVRSLIIGSAQWTVTGNAGTIWDITTSTNLTVTRGSNPINFNYSGATGTRTIIGGTTEAVSLDYNITAGTDIITLNSGGRHVNFIGFSGTLNSTTRTVYGNITLSTGMTLTGSTNVTTMAGTSPQTFVSNGKTFGNPITVSGSGGGLILGDALNLNANTFTFSSAGSSVLTTAGFTLTTGAFNSSSSTGTLTFSTSTINCTTFSVNAGSTVSASSSTINTTGTGTSTFVGAGKTFGAVTFSPTTSGTVGITGSNSFGSVSFTNNSNNTFQATAGTTQTISGALTVNGTSLTNRLTFGSGTAGSIITISSGSISASYINVKDITATNAWNLSGITGGSADYGNNTNITFTAGIDTYWVSGTGSTSDTTKWMTTSGGAVSIARVPYPQDMCNFDANSFTAGSQIVTQNVANFCGMNWIGATNNPTLIMSTTASYLRSITFISAMTLNAATQTATFGSLSGSNTFILTSNGKTIDLPVTINQPNSSTFQLGDNLTMGSTRTLTLTAGTLNDANNNISVGLFSSSNSNVRSVIMGSGQWTITGNAGTVFTTATSTNLTLNRGSNPINLSYAGATGTRVVTGGTTEGASFNISVTAGTDATTISGGFNNLVLTGYAGTMANSARTIYGNFTAPSGGTFTAGANATTFAGSGTQNITSSNKTFDFPITVNKTAGSDLSLVDDLTVGTTRTLTLTQGDIINNDNNITTGLFSSSNSNVRSVNTGIGSMGITSTGTVFDASTSTNLTFTGTFAITNATATSKTFAGGGGSYDIASFVGDNIIVTGSNSFNSLGINNANVTNGLKLTSGTTQTVGDITTNSNAGNLSKLVSTTPASPATISKASGTISIDYISIQDSTATGGASFYAGANSTNVSGNTGWIFTAPPEGGPEGVKTIFNVDIADIKTINNAPISDVKAVYPNPPKIVMFRRREDNITMAA